MVFELESQWAEVFAKLDVVAQTSELHFARDLRWFAGIRAKEPAVPPTAPVGGGATPRRGAYSEEDVVPTVLMSADQVAAEMTAASSPATPTRTRKPAAQATPAIAESVKAAPAVREPRSEAAMFSDWLDEFDLAMTGDVETRDLESTEGGTVITGPERFDVLVAPPLWPDVPLDDKHTTRRAG